MPQKSIASFFSKAPKTPLQASTASNTPDKTVTGPATKTKSGAHDKNEKYPPGTLLWSKLSGYPWWPSLVCEHPTTGKSVRKGQIHVQFLDTPVTRSWVHIDMVKRWGDKTVLRDGAGDPNWEKGVKDAEAVSGMSDQERLDTLLVPLLPSDEEWSDQEEEVSPGSKENKHMGQGGPEKKRRRIIVMDSDVDDSDNDESFKPSKDDVEDQDDDESSGDSEGEPSTGEEEPDSSPVKGSSKRKMSTKGGAGVKRGKVTSSLVSTPVSKFSSGQQSSLSSPAAASPSPLPGVCDSTKKKLAMFSGPAGDSPDSAQQFSHSNLAFLKPGNIKDREKRPMDHPDYDPKTLYVPPDFLAKQTPTQRQWWELKSQHYDVVLFFKMGKFYELFHMDADTGVKELNVVYMKGETAHAGFPEVAYGRYAATLVEKGYKVARIEQTETPEMLDERAKREKIPSKNKTIRREVCQMTSKGTRVNTFLDSTNYEGEPSYLLAIVEKPGPVFGVAFIDTTIGCFNLSQFSDDKNLSRLRTLAAHYPPSEVLYPRSNLSQATFNFLSASLPGARKEPLKVGSEFWDASKTLRVLAEGEYFKDGEEVKLPQELRKYLDKCDSLGLTANPEGELALSSLGAVIFYLSMGYLDQQLLSQRKFEEYIPVDAGFSVEKSEDRSGPAGKFMVLDGITVKNLDILVNSSTGGGEGTLVGRLDSCSSAMGRRTLRHWVVSPLLQPAAIRARQDAIRELLSVTGLQEVKLSIKKLPDLERLLSKIHSAGDAVNSRNHPDSRAVFFENDKYSKRKIMDLLSCLDGLKRCSSIISIFENENFESMILKNITTLESNGGEFPDLTELLRYFENAFDQSSARKDGKIIPSRGVDSDLDKANDNIDLLEKEMKDYLRTQKQHFGCEIKYWGTGKNRFQLEVPASKLSKANDDYELASGTKSVKRYVTVETRQFLARQTAAEDQRDKALMDIQRKMFEQFARHAEVWRKAMSCVSLLDALISLAVYSNSLDEGCFPELVTDFSKPVVDIRDGKHPCLDTLGIAYIPNDTLIDDESRLIILTGPNMGGKSTLMRQTGLLVILAQIGCMVPAQQMTLTPVDRVFTRLGAEDNIIGGESTFLVELQETAAILGHATPHSLVLMDELGRGTATYDGTAIAGAVVEHLVDRSRARTMFATHYHSLAQGAEQRAGLRAAHMACMIENEGHEDITQENITFLYKLAEGAAPKSHGFNAAKLAGLPADIVRSGYARAKQFERREKEKELFQEMASLKLEASDIRDMISKLSMI